MHSSLFALDDKFLANVRGHYAQVWTLLKNERRSVEQSRREKVVVEDGEAEEEGLFWTFN